MSSKGFRYAYTIKSKSMSDLGKELDEVGSAFQNCGWIEVDFLPETGFPTTVIFEWQLDRPPVYPMNF